jgi:hypothetical protein
MFTKPPQFGSRLLIVIRSFAQNPLLVIQNSPWLPACFPHSKKRAIPPACRPAATAPAAGCGANGLPHLLRLIPRHPSPQRQIAGASHTVGRSSDLQRQAQDARETETYGAWTVESRRGGGGGSSRKKSRSPPEAATLAARLRIPNPGLPPWRFAVWRRGSGSPPAAGALNASGGTVSVPRHHPRPGSPLRSRLPLTISE